MRKSQTLLNFNFYTVFAALNSYDYLIYTKLYLNIWRNKR